MSTVATCMKYGRMAFTYALDTLAPPDETVRRLEGMTLADFLAAAGATIENGDETKNGITALFSYRSPFVKAALVELKSNHAPRIAALMGQAVMARYPFKAGPDSELPLLIPIAMTKKKVRERGWNQCELIAKAMLKANAASGLPQAFELRADILKKIRETADQVGMSRAERFKNLELSFGISDPSSVAGRDVIVLDDIATTGATLMEAKRAFESAGARSIFLLSVARAGQDKR